MDGVEEGELLEKGNEDERNVLENVLSKQDNITAEKDTSKIADNGVTQNPEMMSENRADDTSSPNSQAILDNSLDDCEDIENKDADTLDHGVKNDSFSSKEDDLPESESTRPDIEKGTNNDYSSLGDKAEQNAGATVKNVLVEKTVTSKVITSRSRKIIVERSSGSKKGKQFEFESDVNHDVGTSRHWVQVETNVTYAGKDTNARPKDEMEQGKDIAVSMESRAGETSQTNVEDGLVEDKLVKIDIEDGLKSDGLRRVERGQVENNYQGIGEYPEMTFLEIESNLEYTGGDDNGGLNGQPLERSDEMAKNSAIEKDSGSASVEDGSSTREVEKGESTLTGTEDDSENDGLNSIECKLIETGIHEIDENPEMAFVQIESNLAYVGREDDDTNMPPQHGKELERNAVTATGDDSVKDSKVLEDVLNTTEPTTTKNSNVDIINGEDLQSNEVTFDNGVTRSPETIFENHLEEDSTIDTRRLEDALKSGGFENFEDSLLDFSGEGELRKDEFAMQVQHEKEMHELRLTLQDEYQKQVSKISDELREHYQTELDERIAKVEEEWELEFVRQKREYDEQVFAVQREQSTQCQEAIERVTLDAEDQLKNMKYAYERETAEQKQRIKELLEREELWEMKEKELANEKSQKENESLDKIKKLENRLSFEREEVESQLHGAEDEIEALKKQHAIEMGNLTNELDKKYGDIVDDMRKELKSKYQDEMDRKVNQLESHLREQYQQDLEKNKEEIQESTSTLKTKYEKQVAEVLAQLEELHERNQQHELREATLKKNFENEKRKFAELSKEAEEKLEMVRELEKNKKDLKNLEEKFKLCLQEKCILEEKVKQYSESTAKDTDKLQEELAKKSDLIRELEQHVKDSRIKFDELQKNLKKINEEKDSMEKKLSDDLESQKVNAERLQQELVTKGHDVTRLQQNEKEYKELETKVREISQEKLRLEEALVTKTKNVENLHQELPKELGERKESTDGMNDLKKNDAYKELEVKLQVITTEKESLERQLADSKSVMSSLQRKATEDENIVSELKSNYETKISQITRNFEEEVNALESELKRRKNSEEEALGLQKDITSLKGEISKLNDDLQKHKATISELEETSHSRELEIANLILNSPSPQSLNEKEFDFSANPADRARELEIELAQYKKKVQELEEEAEDKFETTVCPNCQDREKSDEILLQTKALVEKIQLDCEKKVQNVCKDLDETEKALQEQLNECEDLKVRLRKVEDDLSEERKRSLEISKLGKNFDVNGNVLGPKETSMDIPDTAGEEIKDDQIGPLNSLQSEPRQNVILQVPEGNATELPQSKDFASLFDEQEKFYKNEIRKKDDDILHLMVENEKIQKQAQDLKQKSEEGKNQREQLRVRTLEQKTKYENEINLMQNEIKVLIRENNELKEQLEGCKSIQEENENLRSKLQESENLVQATFLETKSVQANLHGTENMLKQNSRKYEQDVATLKGVVQEKENYIVDLRNALKLLEKSREGLELDISNQQELFSERERSLVNEIQEMRAAFENEKAKSIEDNFLEKDEIKTSDEMFINKYNDFDGTEMDTDETSELFGDTKGDDRDSLLNESMDIRGCKGVNMDNLTKEPIDFQGYEGVDGDNLPKKQEGNMRSHERVNWPWDNLLGEQAEDGDISYINGYERAPRGRDTVQYEENDFLLNGFKSSEEAITDNEKEITRAGRNRKRAFQNDGKYKQGLEASWKRRDERLDDAPTGSDDEEFDGSLRDRSRGSLFSDGKYKEIGSEENLELLKHEHEVDMLLERKENERLREEIRTLADCVDVFHDECETLKRSLDKTLSIVNILRDERDSLMKEHDLSMAEHSELVLDLIKYEETISRLERGNEKLEDDRKILEDCLMEKQGIASLVGEQAVMPYRPKTECGRPRIDERFYGNGHAPQEVLRRNQALFSSYPKVDHSMELGSEMNDFPRHDTRFLGKGNEYPRNEAKFPRKIDENQRYEIASLERGNDLQRREAGVLRNGSEFQRADAVILGKDRDILESGKGFVLEDGVKEHELERQRFLDRDYEDTVRRLPTRGELLDPEERTFKSDKYYETFDSLKSARTEDTNHRRQVRSRKDEILHKERADFVGTESGVGINQGGTQGYLRVTYEQLPVSSQLSKSEKSRLDSTYRSQTSISPEICQPSARDSRSQRDRKSHEKPKFQINFTPADVRGKRRLQRKDNEKQTSNSKNALAVLPRHEDVSREVLEVPRNTTPPGRFSKRTTISKIGEHKKSRKSLPRNFSPNPKRDSRSSLSNVSTLNSQNFSGSSILTSTRANMTTSDRLVPNLSGLSPIVSPIDRHYHSEKLKWQSSEKDRGNIAPTNYDNTTFLLSVNPFLQTPGTETRKKSRSRCRTADGRLTSSRDLTLSRDLYEEKPLLINFEDFIFRHRVKSSEDVASIRDPSPAELWFS